MSKLEREKWDERYRNGAYEDRTHPTALLETWLPQLRRGTALDLACGAGRNALYLAAHGFTVTALDISAVGLARARRAAIAAKLPVHWLCADLDLAPEAVLARSAFDLVVWVRYVNHALLPFVIASLKPGGQLLCEQHLATEAPVAGPTSRAFRLAPNELKTAAAGLDVLFYREGEVTDPDGRTAALAQLVALAPA